MIEWDVQDKTDREAAREHPQDRVLGAGAGVQAVEVEDGEFSGTLAHAGGGWRWDLFEGDDTQAFASGEATSEALAKDDIDTACISQICKSIY
jgi:hypothetical protein